MNCIKVSPVFEVAHKTGPPFLLRYNRPLSQNTADYLKKNVEERGVDGIK